jgi:hypothetical protein
VYTRADAKTLGLVSDTSELMFVAYFRGSTVLNIIGAQIAASAFEIWHYFLN